MQHSAASYYFSMITSTDRYYSSIKERVSTRYSPNYRLAYRSFYYFHVYSDVRYLRRELAASDLGDIDGAFRKWRLTVNHCNITGPIEWHSRKPWEGAAILHQAQNHYGYCQHPFFASVGHSHSCSSL